MMAESNTNKSSFNNLWILLLVLLIIAASIIILKEYWLQYTADTTQLRRKTVELNNRIDAMQREIATALTQRSEQIATQQKHFEIQRAYRLTKLAADSLHSGRNVALALQLLQAAQADIAQINDPALEKIRAMLNADQQKLNAVNYQDYAAITTKISTLENLIDHLEVKGKPQKVIVRPVATPNKTAKTIEAAKTNPPQWQQILTQTLLNIKNSIKIRKKSEADLDVAHTIIEYKRARFNFLLEELRWSVYYGDAKAYQQTIKELQSLMAQVFNSANSNVEKFNQILMELAAVQINPALPNLQDTVNALQALLVG